MPWGWECRGKLIKQVPAKPTKRRGEKDLRAPGPGTYEIPEIYCGKGFSHVERAPAYTFGLLTTPINKPARQPGAPIFNIQRLTQKGSPHIPRGVVTPHINAPSDHSKVPGPGTYAPNTIKVRYRRPPAYSMKPRARPPYVPWDMWTPSANMYWPAIMQNKQPAYTLDKTPLPGLKGGPVPGPGQYDPKYEYTKKKTPKFSFGAPFRPAKLPIVPAPNTYCEKKFKYVKTTIPAQSFGILHSQYLGVQPAHLKPPGLEKRVTIVDT